MGGLLLTSSRKQEAAGQLWYACDPFICTPSFSSLVFCWWHSFLLKYTIPSHLSRIPIDTLHCMWKKACSFLPCSVPLNFQRWLFTVPSFLPFPSASSFCLSASSYTPPLCRDMVAFPDQPPTGSCPSGKNNKKKSRGRSFDFTLLSGSIQLLAKAINRWLPQYQNVGNFTALHLLPQGSSGVLQACISLSNSAGY